MRKLILFLALGMLLLNAAKSFGQSNPKLSGKVLDSLKPMALVSVRLFKENNTTPLQTTLSNEDGSYQFTKPAAGNYTITFSYSGFTQRSIPVNVSPGPVDIDIPPVALSRSAGVLKEVVITSQRPLVQQSDDKIVFNVEDDPTSKSETAIDLLRKTPFVTVDGDENIKVNGKSNFKVLLNGRETSLFARNVKEALRGFPGALVSKIEVITTPSAKYDGEGVGGLINIITKKKVVGYNGTISTFQRTSDKVNNFSINGNAKFGKFGFSVFLNSGYNGPVAQHVINTTTPLVPGLFTKRTLDGSQEPTANWTFGNAEVNWEIDTLNTISLYANTDSWSNNNSSDQTITTEYAALPPQQSFYHLESLASNPGINIGSDYTRHYESNKEREFSLRFLGEFGKSNSFSNSFQDNPTTDRFLINNSYSLNDQYTIQADNSYPLGKDKKLETGVKAILRRATSDFQSLVKYDPAENYKINGANTDYFKYTQNVGSVYSMYTIRLKKTTIRAGARLEYTNVDGDFVSSKTKVKSSYATLLPNLQFTNKLNKNLTLVVGYTKRLQRPYIWDLNPFVNNNDSLDISYGNPGLGPQTTHALNASLRIANGSTFAGINVEGSYSDNKILQYSTFDPQTGIRRTTSLNIGKEFQSSFNVNFNTKISPRWSLYMNGAIRYSTVTNNLNTSQSNSGFGSNFMMNTVYKINDKCSASSLFGLFKEPQTIQTSYPMNVWSNFAFNYKLFKDKVNVSLRAVNVFEKTHDFKTITKEQNFYSSNISTQVRRAGVLSLTWNFGKLSENVSKKKGVNNDDLLTKPAAPSGN